MVSIRVTDVESFVEMVKELKKKGFLKNLPNQFAVDADKFPMDIPVDIAAILGMVNPVAKKVLEKKIDPILMDFIGEIIE